MKNQKIKKPTARQQQIIDLYLSGLGSTTIAKQLKIHENSVLKVLKQNNVPRRQEGREKTPEDKIRAMEKMYNDGYSLQEVGKEFNISAVMVLKYFKKLNISRRTPEEAHRIYPINENFFDEIDTEEKAYFLGFMYADGCNQTSGICIDLSIIDKDILLKFANLIFINEEDKIKQVKEIDRRNKGKGIYAVLSINSQYVARQMAKFGCVSGKSLILEYPKCIPKHLNRHFLRGYFDGDGTIYNEAEKTSGSAIIGTKEFCESVKNIVPSSSNLYKHDPKTNTNIWVLSFSGNRNIQKFMNFIYSGANIYLERKYQKYNIFCERMKETDAKMFAGTRGYPKKYLYDSYPVFDKAFVINKNILDKEFISSLSDQDKENLFYDIFDYVRALGFNFIPTEKENSNNYIGTEIYNNFLKDEALYSSIKKLLNNNIEISFSSIINHL